jgi:hypothetical protein
MLAGQGRDVEALSLQRRLILALDDDGEVAVPVPVEIEIDPGARVTHRGHHALDELIAPGEAAETLQVARRQDAVGGDAPDAGMLRPGFALAREQLLDAGVVVGEGIDAGKPSRHEFALQPDALITLHREDLGQGVAMAVKTPAAITELDLGT